jgi:hypothetical protein
MPVLNPELLCSQAQYKCFYDHDAVWVLFVCLSADNRRQVVRMEITIMIERWNRQVVEMAMDPPNLTFGSELW